MKSLNNPARVGAFLSMLLPLVLCAAVPAFGATITVTNTNDSGSGSLRAAIAAASPGDTIDFNLSYPATITLASPLTISISLKIHGPGPAHLAVSGSDAVSLFEISAAGVRISGLTIENANGFLGRTGFGAIHNAATGNLTVADCTFSDNQGDVGAGIFNEGTTTVTKSTFLMNFGLNGGAIFNIGTITIADSIISENDGNPSGGGIFNGGTLIMDRGTVSKNTAATGAGMSGVGDATITDSTISDNFSDGGVGGVASGRLTVTNSTISGNRGNSVGGIAAFGPLTLTNDTISGNSAIQGGGILADTGPTAITNSTIAGNTSGSDGAGINVFGSATIKNTVLAGNFNGTLASNCAGAFTSGGHNLSDDTSCADFFTGFGDLNNTPSGLDPAGLKNNGGPTETIALLKISPAVDAIPVSPTNYCTTPDGMPVATDQRGFLRPQGPACDIGAFENTTPAEATETLIRYLRTLDLRDHTEDSLSAILEAALDSLQRGNNRAAGNHLNAFLLHVIAMPEEERLTRQNAVELIRQVQLILQMLGAGTGPSPCFEESLRAECEKEND